MSRKSIGNLLDAADEMSQFFGQRSFEREPLSACRMFERQASCVQCQTTEHSGATHIAAFQFALRQLAIACVERITDDGAAHMAEVNTNLMRATRFGQHAKLDESGGPKLDFIERDRFTTRRMSRADRHLLALIRMRPDGLVDGVAIPVQTTAHNRIVFLFHRTLFKLAREMEVSRVVLGDNHHAACISIQPMDDPRSRRTSHLTQVLAKMKCQRGRQGALPVSLGRMHHHRMGLVDDNQIGVIVENVERDVFWLRARSHFLWKLDCQFVACLEAMRRFAHAAVDEHRAIDNRLTPANATMLRKTFGQQRVDALPFACFFNRQRL